MIKRTVTAIITVIIITGLGAAAEDPLEVEIDEMNRSTRSVPC